jgi:hypothetical protein
MWIHIEITHNLTGYNWEANYLVDRCVDGKPLYIFLLVRILRVIMASVLICCIT